MTRKGKRIVVAIVGLIGLAATAYGGLLIYLFYFWKPRIPQLPREVAEVLKSDAVALVPNTSDPIQVIRRDEHHQTLRDQTALVRWLCSDTLPVRTAVVFSQTEHARALLEMEVVQLTASPVTLPCASTARFYALRDRAPRKSPG